jgi:hypothetical protein
VRECPFCGRSARSKEHVWPRWLRRYPAYRAMNHGRSGERFERTEYIQARMASRSKRFIAEFLPDVQADVCSTCNNGWMSAMEIKVCDLLDPVMRTDAIVGSVLSVEDQTLLAAWFCKCAYAHAATYSDENRAWSSQDYRGLRETLQPPPTATVWVGKNVGLLADIALSVTPVFLTPLAPGADRSIEARPAQASAWLSANSVVFYGLWMPPEMVAKGAPASLAGDEVGSMLKIWPPSEATAWPTGYVSDSDAVSLIDRLASIRDRTGIQIDSLTGEEVEAVKAEMLRVAAAEGLNPPYAILNRLIATRPGDS